MEIAIAAALIAWLITSAYERAKTEYGHERDRHLKDVQKAHPDWSPRRQRRVASHRARGYWANEIAGGFPTMRSAFRENRELARVERAEAEAAGAKRWAELRERLEAAKAEREKYVAEQVRKDPATDKTKARKSWIDRRKLGEALRTGVAAAKIELNEGNGQPTPARPTAPTAAGPDGELPAAQKPDATAGRPKATPGTAPRTDTGTQRHELRRCATCNAPVNGREFLCDGCTELGELIAHIRDLNRRRNATTDPAERDRLMAELLEARQHRQNLHRAMEARKANGGRAPEPANGQANPSGGSGSAAQSDQQLCQRGGQPASRLYPDPGGTGQAVCATCAEGGNCGDPINGQPGSRTCDGCGNTFDNPFGLARHSNGRLLCGPCADAEIGTPGSPGGQADPVYMPDGAATIDSPPSTGGADHDTTTTGGNPVEAPNIDTARANATSVATQIGAVAAGCEQMEADLLAGGLGNDQAALAKFAAAKEALLTAQAAFTEFVTELNKHAAGEEYANTGHAAKTEFLTHA